MRPANVFPFIQLSNFRENCKERVEERQVSEYNGMMMVDVVRSVKIGGATVIVLDAKNMLKF